MAHSSPCPLSPVTVECDLSITLPPSLHPPLVLEAHIQPLVPQGLGLPLFTESFPTPATRCQQSAILRSRQSPRWASPSPHHSPLESGARLSPPGPTQELVSDTHRPWKDQVPAGLQGNISFSSYAPSPWNNSQDTNRHGDKRRLFYSWLPRSQIARGPSVSSAFLS